MPISRREFVSRSLAAVWVTAATACRENNRDTNPDLATHAPPIDSTSPPPKLGHFTPEQAAEIDAVTARIIPTDDSPGAHEAGIVYFIDRSLTTFATDQQKLFADGLTDLSKRVAKKHAGQTRFSALTAEQQDAILRDMEKTPFFGVMRFATISGMFALPKYGGNRDFIGWKLIGRATDAHFESPFGWYDRPENQKALLGRVL